jgi:hypothetical protein
MSAHSKDTINNYLAAN